ncbi:MAG: sigma 54-interacting transcriptional regulator [Isosphaeraceae bacterium]
MPKYRILIVCPDPQGLSLLTSMLKSLGHFIEEAATDRAAVRLMERNPINLVLASVDPGDTDALELLNYVRRKHPAVPVILMFPRVHPERAKEALRLGAMAILKYPVPAAELRAAVLQAMEQCEAAPPHAASAQATMPVMAGPPGRPGGLPAPHVLPVPMDGRDRAMFNGTHDPEAHEILRSPAAVATQPALAMSAPPLTRAVPLAPVSPPPAEGVLITTDPGLRQTIELAASLATTAASVLIMGEPGTGKSLLAQLVHRSGASPDQPFVVLNAEQLGDPGEAADEAENGPADSTSALSDWASKLAQARGGTLHIQEVGCLPVELQLQLFRELQLQDMELAAGRPRMASRPGVRFVISTSENLPALLEQGRFRPELFHRISSLCLTIPPLRHRGADIEVLAEHFRAQFAQEFHRDVIGLTRDAIDTLQRHDWPGNVRELRGVIQRAVARCNVPRVTSGHLAPILNLQRQARAGGAGSSRAHVPTGIRPLKEALEEPEKRIIIQALQAFNWNRQETARVLDINRTTLYKKMKKYGLLIDEPMWVN